MPAHTPGRRISVVGCSGSGKTTLARRLAQHLGYRHIELDALYHQPNWQPLPKEQFKQAVSDALRGDDWVVEGSYSAVRPHVLERSDMVIWLDLPKAVVMRQVLWRTLRRLVNNEELWNGNRERWGNLLKLNPRQSILVWTWQRHAVYRQRYGEEMLNSSPQQPYLRLTSRQAVERFLSSLQAQRAVLSRAPEP
ncbi:adenylate kinase [Pseudomonas sp. 21C1]|uniref:shikimate kinase n=1 Tax=Pseudomonas TaxID=286 RepID=UPI00084AA646|nr:MULTISPECIES: shikimate kinase [Pseudomonas]OEC36866.1 adenylate kinase [Pseudomonas sp. 21C1]